MTKHPAAFSVDEAHLDRARRVLSGRSRLYWVLGGAGAGKSTVCRLLAEQYDLKLCDMDERIYGSFGARYRADQHPANTAWMSAEDPLAWLLGLSWPKFHAWTRAADAEYLGLLAEELEEESEGPILVDGGLSHPALLAQVMPVRQIVCVAQIGVGSRQVWESSELRLGMKEMVSHLPHPGEAWQRFLHIDVCITRSLLQEAKEAHIGIIWRDKAIPVEQTAREVAWALGLGG